MRTTDQSPVRARAVTSGPTGRVHSLPRSTSRSQAARLYATGSRFSLTAVETRRCPGGAFEKPNSDHADTISITVRRRGARRNVMKPRIQCVLAQWIPGSSASGRASGGRAARRAGGSAGRAGRLGGRGGSGGDADQGVEEVGEFGGRVGGEAAVHRAG